MRYYAAECFTRALARLCWAYLDRVAASDWSRATVLLSKIAALYNTRPALVGEFTAIDSLSRNITGVWSRDTQLVVGVILSSTFVRDDGSFISEAGRAAHAAIRESFPGNANQLGPFYTTRLAAAVPADARTWIVPLRTMGVAEMPSVIDDLIRVYVNDHCVAAQSSTSATTSSAASTKPSSGSSSSTKPTTSMSTTAASGGAVVDLDPFVIIGDRGTTQFPQWGYYVLGATAVGVIVAVIYRSRRGRR